jgi:DNA-binding MarR family transcriptional regulator
MTNEDQCAKSILEVAPKIIHFIRTKARHSSDLTVPQFRVLARLSSSPATNSELADIQGISPPTMCRIVEGLVRKGFIKRNKNGKDDRRQIQLCLTKKGAKVLGSVLNKIKLSIITELETLSPSETKALKEGVSILAKVFP